MATDVSLAIANQDKVEGVVARLAMPVAVRNINKLVDYLEDSYGKGVLMTQDGDWLVFYKKPT